MATRAQRFSYQQQRSGPKKPPKPQRPRRDSPVDTSLPGVSATDRKAGGASTAARNRYGKGHDPQKVLEDSSSGRPSRKSTRKGPNRAATALSRRQLARLSTAKSRANRRGAR